MLWQSEWASLDSVPTPLLKGVNTEKSCIQYALVYNTQDDFLLLLTGRVKDHVYNTHSFLLKSFQRWASGLRLFNEHTSPLIPVSVSFAWVVHVSWLMRLQSGYYAACYSSPKHLPWVQHFLLSTVEWACNAWLWKMSDNYCTWHNKCFFDLILILIKLSLMYAVRDGPTQSSPHTKCNSPPINTQCTNFIL